MDAGKQDMTPERAMRLFDRVPKEIRQKAPKKVFFVDYENPQDAYWRRHYKGFTRSYATGGMDEITFYQHTGHDDDYVVRTYCHEIGHRADKLSGTKKNPFSKLTAWQRAVNNDAHTSGVWSPTQYGLNSPLEDFAESTAIYAVDKLNFEVKYPNRAALLASIYT